MMQREQILILTVLGVTLALFLWGRLRHDAVALGALLACVILGLVPGQGAFAGFGHPAVITVAGVLVLSQALQSSGAVDLLARAVLPERGGRTIGFAVLLGLGAALSGFMNNVGAMALLMPVAVRFAASHDLAPGQVLMPLAFGTILGGMTTLVGTPPNLIVAGFRAEAGPGAFGMFDFTPVGLAVALAGLVFVVTLGWRLVPVRETTDTEGFETGAYMTEARVPEASRAAGMTLRAVEDVLGADAQVIGLIRNEVRITAPHGARKLKAGDILVLEAEAARLGKALAELGLELEERGSSSDDGEGPQTAEAGPIALRELVVRPTSALIGRSASDLRLRTRHGLNLLAVARDGQRTRGRLRSLRLRSGDLLLMQGAEEAIAGFAEEHGCVPLALRELRLPERGKAVRAALVMLAAVAAVAFGLIPAAPAFALGGLAAVALKVLPGREVYGAIDWPVVVLLAALIPVADAMQTTGVAALIAEGLVRGVAQGHAVPALALVLVVTMFLSDVMNNAATAAVMSPIALGIAAALGVSADSFLMAVAIGASCAFLTPIGHQNNTLILGPGGFRFGDYWRLGLVLEVLVVAVSLPLLLIVWPL